MNRSLRLKRETLAELTTEQLAGLAAGLEIAITPRLCFLEEFSRTLCGPSHCSGC